MTGPGATPRRAFAHPLKTVMDSGRHPWVWAELDTQEAGTLAGLLDAFVHYYNEGYVTERSEIIPGCWRRHPRLMHELPVLYWQWVTSHHHPDAGLAVCGDFYDKILPSFQSRLNGLIGMGVTMCRKAQHSTAAGDNEIGPAREAADAALSRDCDDDRFADYARHSFRM